ncbi:MAG: type II toxin-antitoxin system Phd/YefM family antitoxin [Nitrospira sp.]|nr:type II toxin-antitoxin system Phd/YefM family antitoxin [Nitrospira sp.]
MKTIGAGKFKAQCLAIFDQVSQEHESYIITKRGKPVAKVVPLAASEMIVKESLSGSIIMENDLLAPIDEDWDVAK